MQVVILCGGKGTRMGYTTEDLPKPLIPIGKRPILQRIMEHYSRHGHKNFLLLSGYKHHLFRKRLKFEKDWKVSFSILKKASKGDRLRKAYEDSKMKFDADGDILLSYGDDMCDVDVNEVIKKHKANKKLVTITSVRPNSSFGLLELNAKDVITRFEEKPALPFWINGGYMVVNRKVLEIMKKFGGDETHAFSRLAGTGDAQVYRHIGFWKSMNTIKDMEELNEKYKGR